MKFNCKLELYEMLYALQINLENIIIAVVAPLIVLFIIWLVRKMWSKTELPKVLVHEAFFLNSNNPKPYYFIKVQSRSTTNNVTITHIWVEDKNTQLHILNNQRSLPRKLGPTDEWETWIEKEKIADQMNIYKNVRVKLSDETILKSKHNKTVPSKGYVAGS